jgi:hypothetical protein
MGALTGRRLGPCGNGFRRGCYGRGFGFRTGYSTPITLTAEEEKKILEANLKELESEKEAITKQLKNLKN